MEVFRPWLPQEVETFSKVYNSEITTREIFQNFLDFEMRLVRTRLSLTKLLVKAQFISITWLCFHVLEQSRLHLVRIQLTPLRPFESSTRWPGYHTSNLSFRYRKTKNFETRWNHVSMFSLLYSFAEIYLWTFFDTV